MPTPTTTTTTTATSTPEEYHGNNNNNNDDDDDDNHNRNNNTSSSENNRCSGCKAARTNLLSCDDPDYRNLSTTAGQKPRCDHERIIIYYIMSLQFAIVTFVGVLFVNSVCL